jgi:hypothetical protein
VDWINVTRNRGQWRVPCEQGKELGVPWNAGNFLTGWELISFAKQWLSCMEFVWSSDSA